MTDEYINKKDVVNLGVMMQTHLWTREQTYNAIFCLPSEDVAPVRHGRWIEKDIIEDRKGMGVISDWQSARCSVCGKYHTTPYAYYFTNYEYCPSCGAKMDAKDINVPSKKGKDNETDIANED